MEREGNHHVKSSSYHFEDYWKEFHSFEDGTQPDEDEDDSKTPDEGEIEEEWLREAGFHSLVDTELPEDHATYDELFSTLTARQRAVVQKRLQTVQLSKRRQRHPKTKQRADVRNVFTPQSSTEVLPPELESHSLPNLTFVPQVPSGPCSIPTERPATFKNTSTSFLHEDQPKNVKPSASVLPPFLRTGHSGGFSLREHSKAIDTESPTSVEVLRYETRTSVIQQNEPPCTQDEGKGRLSPENKEISFKGIASSLESNGELSELDKIAVVESIWKEYVPVAELNEEDRNMVRSLAVIEVAALLDNYGLVLSRRRKQNRKKGKENIVLGASLSAVLELDRRRCPGLKVPLVYQWILHHLHENGLKEEGLMRLGGSVQKVEVLKTEIERFYVHMPTQVESAIRQSTVHDVSALLKQLVRRLPEPLLTNSHMDVFLQVPNIPNIQEQINTLNLLVLAMPDVHRELLQELLYFLANIVSHEGFNRMSLANVAMIMAPNLFPPPGPKKGQHKNNDLAAEVTVAALSSKVTQLLIKYGHILGSVPKELLVQARLQSHYASKKHAKRSGGRKNKLEKFKIEKDITFLANNCPSVIRVHIASFRTPQSVPVSIDERTTAGEVIEKVAQVLDQMSDQRLYEQQENRLNLLQRHRTASEPIPLRQKCLLSAKKPNDWLKDHYLYHVGENIGERMLDHGVGVLGAMSKTGSRFGSGSTWEVRCHH